MFAASAIEKWRCIYPIADDLTVTVILMTGSSNRMKMGVLPESVKSEITVSIWSVLLGLRRMMREYLAG